MLFAPETNGDASTAEDATDSEPSQLTHDLAEGYERDAAVGPHGPKDHGEGDAAPVARVRLTEVLGNDLLPPLDKHPTT